MFAIERLWELTRPVTFDILRDRRLGLVASAGIDAALRDAVAKALKQPYFRIARMTYCLDRMGLIRRVGKQGNAILFERA